MEQIGTTACQRRGVAGSTIVFLLADYINLSSISAFSSVTYLREWTGNTQWLAIFTTPHIAFDYQSYEWKSSENRGQAIIFLWWNEYICRLSCVMTRNDKRKKGACCICDKRKFFSFLFVDLTQCIRPMVDQSELEICSRCSSGMCPILSSISLLKLIIIYKYLFTSLPGLSVPIKTIISAIAWDRASFILNFDCINKIEHSVLMVNEQEYK